MSVVVPAPPPLLVTGLANGTGSQHVIVGGVTKFAGIVVSMVCAKIGSFWFAFGGSPSSQGLWGVVWFLDEQLPWT
jgi:hypothetical protein